MGANHKVATYVLQNLWLGYDKVTCFKIAQLIETVCSGRKASENQYQYQYTHTESHDRFYKSMVRGAELITEGMSWRYWEILPREQSNTN